MKALLTIEWIKTWREWSVFLLAIGMPVGFFLFYSGMTMFDDPVQQKAFVQSYMLTMTAFSMSSFAFFTFPQMIREDDENQWRHYLSHSPITTWQYYLSKVFRVGLNFLTSIAVTFMIGAFVRGVKMPVGRWIGSAVLLMLTSLLLLLFGLLISYIKSKQLMSIVGNIAFLGLALLAGSWMPISLFPSWLQTIAKVTPLYYVNQLIVNFASDGKISGRSLLMILAYGIMTLAIIYKIQGRKTR